jgi:hypothetical protein
MSAPFTNQVLDLRKFTDFCSLYVLFSPSRVKEEHTEMKSTIIEQKELYPGDLPQRRSNTTATRISRAYDFSSIRAMQV